MNRIGKKSYGTFFANHFFYLEKVKFMTISFNFFSGRPIRLNTWSHIETCTRISENGFARARTTSFFANCQYLARVCERAQHRLLHIHIIINLWAIRYSICVCAHIAYVNVRNKFFFRDIDLHKVSEMVYEHTSC